MLMVRNLCRLPLLFSVQDHKQCLCHIIFYLFINGLIYKYGNRSGKAASAFRLWASKRQAGSAYCRSPGNRAARLGKNCVTAIAQCGP
jgi:hypothetical protein